VQTLLRTGVSRGKHRTAGGGGCIGAPSIIVPGKPIWGWPLSRQIQ